MVWPDCITSRFSCESVWALFPIFMSDSATSPEVTYFFCVGEREQQNDLFERMKASLNREMFTHSFILIFLIGMTHWLIDFRNLTETHFISFPPTCTSPHPYCPSWISIISGGEQFSVRRHCESTFANNKRMPGSGSWETNLLSPRHRKHVPIGSCKD